LTDVELLGLVRQGQRYWIAARQDNDPVIRHLHLNYAFNHFELALHGAPRDRIQRVTGVQIDRMLGAVQREQDAVQQELLAIQGGVRT
jgi:hypothetical protein